MARQSARCTDRAVSSAAIVTAAVIFTIRSGGSRTQRGWQAAPLEGELAISAISLAELHFGVLVAKERKVRAERLRRLLVLQRTFDALPLDDAVAASYGQVATAVVDVGRRPRARSMDLLIAATAHAHSARLYTRNLDDFQGLDGLVDIVAV